MKKMRIKERRVIANAGRVVMALGYSLHIANNLLILPSACCGHSKQQGCTQRHARLSSNGVSFPFHHFHSAREDISWWGCWERWYLVNMVHKVLHLCLCSTRRCSGAVPWPCWRAGWAACPTRGILLGTGRAWLAPGPAPRPDASSSHHRRWLLPWGPGPLFTQIKRYTCVRLEALPSRRTLHCVDALRLLVIKHKFRLCFLCCVSQHEIKQN